MVQLDLLLSAVETCECSDVVVIVEEEKEEEADEDKDGIGDLVGGRSSHIVVIASGNPTLGYWQLVVASNSN